MSSIAESSQQDQAPGNGIAPGLASGVDLISASEVFEFRLYKRLVLPLDGFVFWVLASQVSPQFIASYDAVKRADDPDLTQATAALSLSIAGSLHLSQEINHADASINVNQSVTFTTTDQVNDFAATSPDEMYILTLPNGSKAAFSSSRNFYTQAGLWHYSGKAIQSPEEPQIIDSIAGFDLTRQIVSNSLPLWLAFSSSELPIFPSYLIPQNLKPPYISVDITGTSGFGQTPMLFNRSSQDQLVNENVAFTCFGMGNNDVLDFQLQLIGESESGNYGIMEPPVPIDEKLTQAEFQIIAQKKKMSMKVNYLMSRTRDIARKQILSAFIEATPA